MILPGKCHHIVTAFDHQREWERMIEGESEDEEFKNFFIKYDYSAAVDGPFCFMYKRAMEVFPDAKVLLTVRDAEKWALSVKETILQDVFLPFPANLFNWLHIFQDYLGLFPVLISSMYKMKHYNEMVNEVKRGNGVAFYNRWVMDVAQHVPPEKLLNFSVTEGWEPLCNFLDVPLPNDSFPRINSSQAFIDRLGKRKRRSWLLLYEFVSIPVLSALVYCYTR